ncbi:uncharacterized protein LOC134285044 isoform X2 [Aedes albopictus]
MPPIKKKVYTAQAVAFALDAAKRGMSIRQAAARFNVPAGTLRDRLRNKYGKDKKGPSSILNDREEARIVNWMEIAARTGFPVTVKQLRVSVAQFVRLTKKITPFKDGIPGRKWSKLFLRRHKQFSSRKPSILAKHRATVTEPQIRNWFKEVHEYLKEINMTDLLDQPGRIFNLDETAFQLVVKNQKCLAPKEMRHLHTVYANNDKESYTGLFTACADGRLLPPLVLFPYKRRIPAEISLSAPHDWGVDKTDSGWMTGQAFFQFLKTIFQPWLVRENIQLPVVLFVDGHKSHTTLMTTEFCTENQIILVALYPNTTHLTQPLDVSFFGPLKKYWQEQILKYRKKYGMIPITKPQICPLIKEALLNFTSKERAIRSGFMRSGIYPWCPDAINYSSLPSNASMDESNDSSKAMEFPEVKLIRLLESRLTIQQFHEFQQQEKSVEWPGNICDTNLFYLWRNLKITYNDLTNNAQEDNVSNNLKENQMSDDESDFEGFAEDEIDCRGAEQQADFSRVASVGSKSIEDAAPENNESDKENDEDAAFSSSFSLPTTTKPTRRREILRPPTVATSKQFAQFMEEKAKKKDAVELEKQQKRKERELKRAKKEAEKQNKKRKPRNIRPKPRSQNVQN